MVEKGYEHWETCLHLNIRMDFLKGPWKVANWQSLGDTW